MLRDMSNEEYHSHSAISRSVLWTFRDLPQKYWYQYLSGEYVRPKESEDFAIGNAVHTMILEPELFDEQFFVTAKVNRATKVGKEAWSQALVNAGTRTILNTEQYAKINAMYNAVMGHDRAKQLFTGGVAEKSIFWTHEPTGIEVKARPDYLNQSKGLVVDLKTTASASPRDFQLSAFKYGYGMQSAMLFKALEAIGEPMQKMVFVCVEKTAPYCVGVYVLSDEFLEHSINQFEHLMIQFKECLDNDEWPGYPVQVLELPRYAKMELEE
jgi:hypothetical protein